MKKFVSFPRLTKDTPYEDYSLKVAEIVNSSKLDYLEFCIPKEEKELFDINSQVYSGYGKKGVEDLTIRFIRKIREITGDMVFLYNNEVNPDFERCELSTQPDDGHSHRVIGKVAFNTMGKKYLSFRIIDNEGRTINYNSKDESLTFGKNAYFEITMEYHIEESIIEEPIKLDSGFIQKVIKIIRKEKTPAPKINSPRMLTNFKSTKTIKHDLGTWSDGTSWHEPIPVYIDGNFYDGMYIKGQIPQSISLYQREYKVIVDELRKQSALKRKDPTLSSSQCSAQL